ncbi:Protein CBG05761 [Caenorhabditis briggsae]|uniref:Protein CBG05761 n=1 Tax=Caenorhabditis briggsae TaxID=6238 RepID=A8X1P5_CAEBR|nr:Protein CBG05761 [Caenorhabditis briggsae]CAP26555.1 Protein CBG05761 [Caenorhabditis briggsae]
MGHNDVWKALSGVVCVYKHSGMSSSALIRLIRRQISQSIVDIESTSRVRLPMISLPVVEPHSKSGALVVVGKNELADYRYHPLVSGRSIRPEDVQMLDALPLATNSSGICLFGINDGCDLVAELRAKSWTNVYRLDGLIKKPVENQSEVLKVTRHRIEKVLSRMESEFRGASFRHANVDLESSEAFELARRGTPRAQLPGAQIIYSIDLNWFRSPRFSVTAQCSGEDDEMLRRLIEHIGSNLGMESAIIRIQRQNFGPFGSENALLEKQINLQNIVRNIQLNRGILSSSASIDKKVVTECSESEHSSKSSEIFDGFGLKESTKLDDYDAMRPVWPRNY